jgi:uncharacterized protein YukE
MAKNEKEWRALGSELVEAYNHLMNALRRISDLPPMRKSDTTALSKAIDWTGRAKAEYHRKIQDELTALRAENERLRKIERAARDLHERLSGRVLENFQQELTELRTALAEAFEEAARMAQEEASTAPSGGTRD